MRRDPIIIGGGPAGCAAAISLARAGCRPRLLERSTGPTDKVCGDFLSAEAIDLVHMLGVDPVALGAVPIRRVRISSGNRTAEAQLPFAAVGLSRRLLDEALLRHAEAAGADVRRGETVRRLTPGWIVQTAAGTLQSGTVFLATGKHDLRDLPRARSGKGAIGLKTYLDADRSDTVELFLFPGGYAGLQPVEQGRAVLCAAIRHDAFPGTWPALLAAIEASCPRFARVLDGSDMLLEKPVAVAGIPYGFQAPASASGLYRLGDQAAVIPSLTGDGMAIALYSGNRAASAWLAGRDAASFQAELRHTLSRQMTIAGALHTAGLRAPLQSVAVIAAKPFPGLIRLAARLTRLRPVPIPRTGTAMPRSAR